ncbi:glycerol-3-phosphate dehydrogenase [Microbotryomycetes sp. JL221]|nr:glycerol-3-phosphate dehydrogenase [Microbotryomycetes sp. JL221]
MSSNTITTTSDNHSKKWKVAIIGSGNWGSAIAKIVGTNVHQHSHLFDTDYKGHNLSDLFNQQHENVKYLPGIKINPSVKAEPNLVKACQDANALIFVLPHQFIKQVCQQLKGNLPQDARAISLIKGVEVNKDNVLLFSDVIEQELGISCAALSGANIADEVAKERFSETTIACRNDKDGQRWLQLFHTDYFRCHLTDDVAGVALCGALKNVVAVAAGLVDGLGLGNNAKAAIMRIGILEMKNFAKTYFPGVRDQTFVEQSAGVADVITSCLGGRNRKCAEAFVSSGKSFDDLEKEMLNGQKLQGVLTAKEIHEFLEARGKVQDYPLFNIVYKIAYKGLPPQQMTAHL